MQELKQLEQNNKEGFVIRFKNGFRIKMKFAEYVRLHRIITGVSNVAIWEYLVQGKSFDELLEKVPDEFYNWVKSTANDLQSKFDAIKDENEKIFWQLIDKKEFALKAKHNINQHLLFTRLNSYSTKMDEQIWKMIRPQYSKPFRTDNNI